MSTPQCASPSMAQTLQLQLHAEKKNLSFSVPRCLTGRSKGAKRGEEMFSVCEDRGSQAALLKLKYLRSALETALISPEK